MTAMGHQPSWRPIAASCRLTRPDLGQQAMFPLAARRLVFAEIGFRRACRLLSRVPRPKCDPLLAPGAVFVLVGRPAWRPEIPASRVPRM